jgi:hypothetical protein
MSVKRGWLGAALLVLAAGNAVRAQSSTPLSTQPPGAAKPAVVTATALPLETRPTTNTAPPAASPSGVPPAAPPSTAPLNPYPFDGTAGPIMTDAFPVGPKPQTTEGYLAYEQPGCCGPLGANGPLDTDIYFRTGPAFVAGPSALAHALQTGWRADLGGRELFFDPSGSSAWVVDLGLVYIFNNSGGNELVGLERGRATVRELHRWAVGAALGRDWFASAPGFVTWGSPCTIGYGVDAGARWGTSHVVLNVIDPNVNFARLHDNFGTIFIAAHADYEVPMGGWTFLVGGRLEWGYNFIGVLPENSNNFHDISLLLTTGVRY